ncbi:MAG: ParB/RepB/Spo0J family partition protein [Thermoplasmatota archaeon]
MARAVTVPATQRGLAVFAPEIAELGKKPATEATAVLIPVSKIDVPGELASVPLDEANVETIAATVRSDGLHNPIEVRARANRYELVDGRHRLDAHRRLGLLEILAFVRNDLDDVATAAARTVTNVARRVVPPIERARAYHALAELGLTQEQVAQRVGASTADVQRHLGILDLPDKVAVIVGAPDARFSWDDIGEMRAFVKSARDANMKDLPERVELALVAIVSRKNPRWDPWGFKNALKTQGVKLVENDWQRDGDRAYKAALAKTVTIGPSRDAVRIETPAFMDALAALDAKKAETRAKAAKGDKGAQRELAVDKEAAKRRLENEVERVRIERERAALAKALRATLSLGARELETLERVVLMHANPTDDQLDAILDACGLTSRDIGSNARNGRDYDFEAAIKKLRSAGKRAVAARLLAGLAAYHLHEPGRDAYAEPDERVLKLWTGATSEQVEAKARADLVKTAKLRKDGKLPKAGPWWMDERRVKCDTCGAVEGKWCSIKVAFKAYVTRTFHAARIAAAAKVPIKEPAVNPASAKKAKPRARADDEDLDDDAEG